MLMPVGSPGLPTLVRLRGAENHLSRDESDGGGGVVDGGVKGRVRCRDGND